MELMYLNDIREQMPAILDVNVEAMGENGQIATARYIKILPKRFPLHLSDESISLFIDTFTNGLSIHSTTT